MRFAQVQAAITCLQEIDLAKKPKRLGGKAPRRGGRLSAGVARAEVSNSPPPIPAIVIACLVLGIVGGYAYSMDRQLRGGLLAQRAEAEARQDWVPLAELPAHVPRAFLTVIEPSFGEGAPVRTRDESKSVPRELIRQIHLLEDGLGSRARELAMTPVLERHLDQNDLLELYLNRIYLGEANGYPVYGVHYAAVEYFDKSAAELTVGEAATLAGLLLDPRIEDPAERPGAVGVRRNEVLRGLLRDGHIDAGQYQAAVQERLAFQPGLADAPMTRRILTAEDTATIRLPPEYRPQPPTEEASE